MGLVFFDEKFSTSIYKFLINKRNQDIPPRIKVSQEPPGLL